MDSPLVESPQPQATPDVAAMLVQDSTQPVDGDYSEFCWSQIYPHDYRYLTAPRNCRSPCSWCGGRLHHTQACVDLRASFWPEMTFGKYKGKRLSAIPKNYLEWLAATQDGDLREAAKQCLHSDLSKDFPDNTPSVGGEATTRDFEQSEQSVLVKAQSKR